MLNFKINDKQGVELTFDGEDKKLADELGDVFWGIALACELGGESFFDVWQKEESWGYHCASVKIDYHLDIDPLECLKRNIAKLADRKARGVIKGNGDER